MRSRILEEAEAQSLAAVTFRDLKAGEWFRMLDGTRHYQKIDDRHYVYFTYPDGGDGSVEQQEAVSYGRVGVGDNPVVRVEGSK